jgi:hypothetical protein
VAGGDDLHLPLPWLRWRRQKLDDPLATVDVRQMEVCLSICLLLLDSALSLVIKIRLWEQLYIPRVK